MRSRAWLARQLPDIPRWVEARDLLIHGPCEVSGIRELPSLSAVVRDPDGSIFLIGRPALSAVRAAARIEMIGGFIVALPQHAGWLSHAFPDWPCSRAILHVLLEPGLLPAPTDDVGFLDRKTLDDLDLPELLRTELEIGARDSPIAVTYVDGKPVSFCYAGSVTEKWWDVAIDTLPGHRRSGCASRSAAFMIRHMRELGKSPVWAAVHENPASWRLARKMGFEAVDEVTVLERPGGDAEETD